MLLLHSWVAQVEHREWERQFNKRAARGDFVRPELELKAQPRPEPKRVRLALRLRLPLLSRLFQPLA